MAAFLPLSEYNASQVTLVAPESTTTLVFSKHSTLNTVLFLHGNPVFKIATVDVAADRTAISDALTGEVVVTIQRRDVLPSTVVFSERSANGTRKVRLKEWLKADVMKSGEPLWKIETPVGNFTWKTDALLRLALCPASNLEHPIAWVQSQTKTDPFALILTGGTEPFREEIVASFIVLEHRMRMSEKTAYLKERRFYRARIADKLV